MEEKNNGGPAFPVQEYNGDGTPATLVLGMTLRDYFATHSPFGVNQALDIVNGVGVRNTGAKVEDIAKTLAELNYAYANAMLSERDR